MLKKIIIVLVVASLILSVYLFMSRKSTEDSGDKINKVEKIDQEKLENNYKAEVKLVFGRFLVLVDKTDLSVLELREVRDELLNLKVPTKFKDLHLGLALAMSRLESSLSVENEEDKEITQDIIKKVEEDYDWINK